MGWFSRRAELRAGEVVIDDPVLRALLGGGTVTRDMASQVPTVSGGIDLIAGIVAGTPIKLYRDTPGQKAVEIPDDPRIRLLNDETGDTLDANQFWRAMVRDYYLGKGGYAYIHRVKGKIKSLHYIEESRVSILKNADPIFKDFAIFVNGSNYQPFEFLKLLRNTPDGAQGVPITIESAKLIETAYSALVFEGNLVKKGGNKKGFLQAKKKLTQEVLDSLKAAFRGLYRNDSTEAFMVLNDGVEFHESSNTSVELQLNENKAANAEEFAKIFHISTGAMSGAASEGDVAGLARLAAIPLMKVIECALNRDFLLEKEKGLFYWAFDTKELLKGGIFDRYRAYEIAVRNGWKTRNEIRYQEDEPAIQGMDVISLGLSDVIYDPAAGTYFTPNTKVVTDVQGGAGVPLEARLPEAETVTVPQVKQAVEEVVSKTLNGAQTQSLITVVQQYQGGALTLQQAMNIIAVSIGITREEAKELIGEAAEGGNE